MPTPQRRQHTSAIERLITEPYRYELMQSLRMVELWLNRNGYTGEQALPCHVRFSNSLSMAFPPSEIEALTAVAPVAIDNAQALQSALQAGQLHYLRLTAARMGFFGVHGAMPYHYTDSIASQIANDKFEGGRAFFDIFTNRMMHLQYQAWSKYRIHYRQDARGQDTLLSIQLALAGALPARGKPLPDANPEDEAWNEVKAHYAAILRHRPTSASAIGAVMTEYFGVPVRVEQFAGNWDVLADKDRLKLGKQRHVLGQGVIIGVRRWDRKSTARLRVGPLTRAQFDSFLPGTDGYRAIKRMLSLFALPPIAFELRLVLRSADVKGAKLGGPNKARLGRGAFLATRPATADRDDHVYALL